VEGVIWSNLPEATYAEAVQQRSRLLLEIPPPPPPPAPRPERHPALPAISCLQFPLCRPSDRLRRLAKSPQKGAAHALAIIAGTPVEHLPGEIVMSAENMVDASLAGLAEGEFVTIPALEDAGLLAAYEQAPGADAEPVPLGAGFALQGRITAIDRGPHRPRQVAADDVFY